LPTRYKGEVQFIDLSYFVPWGGWTQMQTTAKWLPQPLQVGNPAILFYNAYVLGFDPFTGREIAQPYQTLAEQRAARNRYFKEGILPELVGGRATERLVKVVKDEPDYYGRKPDWKREVLRDLTGVNIILGGELTTGVSTWKSEEYRKGVERKRPVKQALLKAIKSRNPEEIKEALDLLKALPVEEQKLILNSVFREYKQYISRVPAFMKLSEKEKEAYLKHLQELKTR